MEPIVFGSPEFEQRLIDSAHVAGEVHMLDAICEPGVTALDVGGHRGVSTLALANAAGPEGNVWAFEPVPEYFDALSESLRLSHVANTRAYRLALSDHNGGLAIYKHGGGSGVVPSEEAEEWLPVPADTVDGFVATHGIGRVDVLSADCEGSELALFRGAASTLRRDGPAIFCEVHHSYLDALDLCARDVADYLERVGYTVRPLRVEDLEADVAIEDCTHIHAWFEG
jgi:FkbM family methyltransferase